MKYKVDIVETYRKTVAVESENEDEAYEKVNELINDGEIDLPRDGGYDYWRELFVGEEESGGFYER